MILWVHTHAEIMIWLVFAYNSNSYEHAWDAGKCAAEARLPCVVTWCTWEAHRSTHGQN